MILHPTNYEATNNESFGLIELIAVLIMYNVHTQTMNLTHESTLLTVFNFIAEHGCLVRFARSLNGIYCAQKFSFVELL